jgi:hypothetical protein
MAALFIVLILAFSFLAVYPAAHRLVHKDANQPGHECAITLFARSQILPVTAASISVFVVLGLLPSFGLPEKSVCLSRPFALPPSCGPPAASL